MEAAWTNDSDSGFGDSLDDGATWCCVWNYSAACPKRWASGRTRNNDGDDNNTAVVNVVVAIAANAISLRTHNVLRQRAPVDAIHCLAGGEVRIGARLHYPM